MKSPMFQKCLGEIIRRCHTKINSQPYISDWKTIIGLEVHAQLSAKTKLFSAAPALYGAPTNSAVSLFDSAIPGTLPSLNKSAVELAVSSALALGCRINSVSYFDRKHYFYPDLPAGYQITQQRVPIAQNGKIDFAVYQPGLHKNPFTKTCKIKQIQLEQDSGKSFYEFNTKQSFIDLNRAGVALVEIVFEPEVESAIEACFLIKEVMTILEKVGSCSCKMQEGALRVDANVSVHKEGTDLGVRTEIKNLGSIHALNHAITYEVERQVNLLEKGGVVKNETLAWDLDFKRTVPIRDKEEKQDYRFMPEPNLPPLRLLVDEYSECQHKNTKSKAFILNLRHLKGKIPTVPQQDRTMLTNKFNLSEVYAFNLVSQPKLFNYFMEMIQENPYRDPKTLYLLLLNNLLMCLNHNKIETNQCPILSSHLGEIADMLQERRISKRIAEVLLELLLDKENTLSPTELVSKHNLYMISSPKELKKLCLKVMEQDLKAVALYKKKKQKDIFNALVGKVLQESNFRADTKVLPGVLAKLLDKSEEN